MIIKPNDPAAEIAGSLLVALHGHQDKLRQIAELILKARERKPRPAPSEIFNERAAEAERECRTCRETFVPRAPTQMFCSPGCQQAGAAARALSLAVAGRSSPKVFAESTSRWRRQPRSSQQRRRFRIASVPGAIRDSRRAATFNNIARSSAGIRCGLRLHRNALLPDVSALASHAGCAAPTISSAGMRGVRQAGPEAV
jgi:hypothetical protein